MNPCFYRPMGKIDRRSRCFANSVRVLSGIRSGSHADCTPNTFQTFETRGKTSRPGDKEITQKRGDRGSGTYITENQFLSNIFTVPKKDGTRRLLIDLRQLNQFVKKVPFKMEDLTQIPSVLQKGDFLCKIDLQDAYLLISVAKKARVYLRFL